MFRRRRVVTAFALLGAATPFPVFAVPEFPASHGPARHGWRTGPATEVGDDD